MKRHQALLIWMWIMILPVYADALSHAVDGLAAARQEAATKPVAAVAPSTPAEPREAPKTVFVARDGGHEALTIRALNSESQKRPCEGDDFATDMHDLPPFAPGLVCVKNGLTFRQAMEYFRLQWNENVRDKCINDPPMEGQGSVGCPTILDI